MNTVNVIFYVLVILAFIQIDRRLHDIVKGRKTLKKQE